MCSSRIFAVLLGYLSVKFSILVIGGVRGQCLVGKECAGCLVWACSGGKLFFGNKLCWDVSSLFSIFRSNDVTPWLHSAHIYTVNKIFLCGVAASGKITL